MKTYKIGYSLSMFADRNVCKEIDIKRKKRKGFFKLKRKERYFYFEAIGNLNKKEINLVGILDESELKYRMAGTKENKKHLANMKKDIKRTEKEMEFAVGDERQFFEDHIKMVKNNIKNFVYITKILKKQEMFTYHEIFVQYNKKLGHKISTEKAIEMLEKGDWKKLNGKLAKVKLNEKDTWDNKAIKVTRI